MVITWEAVAAICAVVIVVGGFVHWYTSIVVSRAVDAAVSTLRLEFAQWLTKMEAQNARHEVAVRELAEIRGWLDDHETRLRKLEGK